MFGFQANIQCSRPLSHGGPYYACIISDKNVDLGTYCSSGFTLPAGHGWIRDVSGNIGPVFFSDKMATEIIQDLICKCKGKQKCKLRCQCKLNQLPCTELCPCFGGDKCGNTCNHLLELMWLLMMCSQWIFKHQMSVHEQFVIVSESCEFFCAFDINHIWLI